MIPVEAERDGQVVAVLVADGSAGRVRRPAVHLRHRVTGIGGGRVQDRADRQPGRDRAAGRPHLPGAGAAGGRGLLHRGPRLRRGGPRRPGGLHRTRPGQAQLPQHVGHHRGGAAHRRRRGPPGLRLPLRGTGLRRGLRGLRPDLRRPARGRDGAAGRQVVGARGPWPRPACRCCRAASSRSSTPTWRPRSRPTSATRSSSRRSPAAAGAACGWSAKPASCRSATARSAATAQALFGDDRVYIERYLPAARHVEVQVLCDALRQRRPPGAAGLLGAAPAPEDHRGDAGARLPAALADEMGEAAVRGALAAGYVGAGTVEFLARRPGPLVLHGGQLPHPGRAPGHRDGHRHRPGARAAADRRRGAVEPAAKRPGAARRGDRVPDQRRGPGARLRAHARPADRARPARRPVRAGRHRRPLRQPDLAGLRPAAGQGLGLGAGPAAGAGADAARAGRVPRRRPGRVHQPRLPAHGAAASAVRRRHPQHLAGGRPGDPHCPEGEEPCRPRSSPSTTS